MNRRQLLQFFGGAVALAAVPDVARRYFIIGDPTRRLWTPARFAILGQANDLRGITGALLSSQQEFWTQRQRELHRALKQYAAERGYHTTLDRVSVETWNFGACIGLADEFVR